MNQDIIERFAGCLIQHGDLNRRIYLMKWCGGADGAEVLGSLDALAAERKYTKIFAKVPARYGEAFLCGGYREEARIPGYFDGDDCLFLARYLSEDRSVELAPEQVAAALRAAEEKAREAQEVSADPDPGVEKAGPDDAGSLAALYREVFPVYPFPIDDPEYIRETMKTHIDYYVVRDGGRTVAASSAEKDHDTKSVEMTDFATRPDYRRRGMAGRLLRRMEKDMRAEGMRTLYTIARALSAGMNVTFARAGYAYAGTLVNNTCISGGIESMNVWYRQP